MQGSDPLRAEIRSEVNGVISNSRMAAEALRQLCGFYNDHKQPDAARNPLSAQNQSTGEWRSRSLMRLNPRNTRPILRRLDGV